MRASFNLNFVEQIATNVLRLEVVFPTEERENEPQAEEP
jgi:hypothetical protein